MALAEARVVSDLVKVEEAAPVRVTRGKAVRILLGRFVIDYVETFVALIPAQLLALIVTPQLHFSSIEEAKVATIAWIVQLVGPGLSAFVSAGRRSLMTAWPSIKAWLDRGGGAP
jgi:uncharacterized membrane protein YGL010W